MRKTAPPFRRPPVNDDGTRINEQITARQIRLIDQNGEMVGVVTNLEGMRAAEAAGLDLVEISPDAQPPVCKLLNYGKYKYEQQKKSNEARKKQKVVDTKEIKLRPGIEDHDYGVKLKAARRFLEEGDKVKVTLRFRGRELSHLSLGMEVMKRMREDLIDIGKVEQEPRMEGKQAMMLVGPLG